MAVELNPWIYARQRRAAEVGVVTVASPAIFLTCLVAAGAIKLADKSEKITNEVERAIVPHNTFTVRKLSSPHSKTLAAIACRKTMIDELPQAIDILNGRSSLWGPRPASPEHISNSYEAVKRFFPQLYEEALSIHSWQKHGILSSYAILSHAGNLEGLDEDVRFPAGAGLSANSLQRLSLNVRDYRTASLRSELGMINRCIGMVRTNYGYYIGRAMDGNTAEAPICEPT